MKLQFSTAKAVVYLFLISFSFFSSQFVHSDIIADYDFEGTNDPTLFSPFSDGGLDLTLSTDSPNGFGPSEGAEVEITGISGSPSFGGATFGIFDLGLDSRFTAGSITASDLDLLIVEFDVEVVGPATGSFRLEASSPVDELANSVELTSSVFGAYQRLRFDLINLNAAQKSNLADSLNVNGTTNFNLVFEFDGSAGFDIGNAIRVDNLLIQTVPEPGSIGLFFSGSILILARRRRKKD